MNPFLVGWSTARRRGAGSVPPRRPHHGTARLLALEAGWLAGQVLRPSRLLPAAAVGVLVAVLLAPITPGPVLAGGWRNGVAAAATVVSAVIAHVLLKRAGDEDDRTSVVLRGVATISLVASSIALVSRVLFALSGEAVPSGAVPGGGLAIDRPLALGAVLLVGGVLAARVGDRLRVPSALALLLLGMALGAEGLAIVDLGDPELVQGIAVVALVIILYAGGLGTRPRALRGAVAPGVLLATLGTAVTAGVVALLCTTLLGMERSTALVLAAVVAPTDAAAVFAVLRRTPVPRRLAGVLQVESGANDPIAVLLTVVFLNAADLAGDVGAMLGFGIAQLGLGVAIGTATGLVGARLVVRASDDASGLVPVLAIGIGGSAYGLTALAGGSGFLAVYLCGVALAVRAPDARRALRTFSDGLASTAEVGLFLLLGLLVAPSTLPPAAGLATAVTAVLLLVARPLAVALSLGPFGFDRTSLVVVSWLGMRGAVPIVLATVAFSSGFPQAVQLFDVVFVVVLASTLVQGLTAGPLLARTGLVTQPSPIDPVLDSSPFEGLDGTVIEVQLTSTSRVVGRPLSAVPPPGGALVTAIVRGGRLVVPHGSTRLLAGDQLVLASDAADAGPAIRRWAS